ncbi:MAG TPA: tetratricopeptide repeat protein [Lentimicrobium sp.]|nr:tetratricopeptide repeat protein [Lentimicrobium sp.]
MKFDKYTLLIIIAFCFIAHFESFSQVTDKAKLLQFEEAITRGEEFMKLKDYAKAKEEYQKALSIDPSAKYPKDKLAQIRKVYIDPKDEADYHKAVSQGDQYILNENYTEAKEQYSIALLIKPDDRVTREKMVNAEKKASEKEAMLRQYESVNSEADRLFNLKDYRSAIEKYKEAQSLNSQDSYATNRIKESGAILEKQQVFEENYNRIISEADEAYMNRNFVLASSKYTEASKLKPSDNYPKSMLERVGESIRNKAANDIEQDKLMAEKHRQDSINAINASIEQALKEAEEARLKTAEAARILADQKAEENRIAESNRIAEEVRLNEESRLAEEARLKEEARLTEEARLKEEARLADETRLAEEAKISEENRLAEAARLAEETRLAEEAKALADKKAEEERIAKEKLDEEVRIAAEKEVEKKRLEYEMASQIDKEYFDAIEKGNELFKEEDFTSAILMYEKASALKPLEDFPKDRLLLIHNLLIERLKYSLEAYNKNISAGDQAYQSNIFDKAIEEYEKASVARPEETYPGLMIEKIRKLMEENAMVSLITNSMILTDAAEEKFKFKPVDMKLRKNNYIIIKAKKTSEKAPKIFINYGKDDIKSGGIVVKSLESDETVNYMVRISSQDKWYRVDNNWISLYPEGGSIEITSMQISQGDIQKVQ